MCAPANICFFLPYDWSLFFFEIYISEGTVSPFPRQAGQSNPHPLARGLKGTPCQTPLSFSQSVRIDGRDERKEQYKIQNYSWIVALCMLISCIFEKFIFFDSRPGGSQRLLKNTVVIIWGVRHPHPAMALRRCTAQTVEDVAFSHKIDSPCLYQSYCPARPPSSPARGSSPPAPLQCRQGPHLCYWFSESASLVLKIFKIS